MKNFLIGFGIAFFLTGCGSAPAAPTPPPAPKTAAEKEVRKEKARTGCERVGGTLQTITREDGSSFSFCAAN